MNNMYNVLGIGSASTISIGGIHGDLKTFSALGVYGVYVISSLFAQNTRGLQSYYPVPSDFILVQLNSVFDDFVIHSVKIGALFNSCVVRMIFQKLKKYVIPYLILDVSMVSFTGDLLLDNNTVECLKNIMFPISSIVILNLYELGILLGCKLAKNECQVCVQGKKLLDLGCKAVLIKGGHLFGSLSSDWYITLNKEICFSKPRVDIINVYGVGGVFSAALTALRPRYNNWEDTILFVKNWLYNILMFSKNFCVGKGYSVVHNFF